MKRKRNKTDTLALHPRFKPHVPEGFASDWVDFGDDKQLVLVVDHAAATACTNIESRKMLLAYEEVTVELAFSSNMEDRCSALRSGEFYSASAATTARA